MPEGTRSFDGVLARPKPGVSLLATRTGAAVLPVGISGTDRLHRPRAAIPNIGTRMTLRAGEPFHLRIPEGADRKAAGRPWPMRTRS